MLRVAPSDAVSTKEQGELYRKHWVVGMLGFIRKKGLELSLAMLVAVGLIYLFYFRCCCSAYASHGLSHNQLTYCSFAASLFSAILAIGAIICSWIRDEARTAWRMVKSCILNSACGLVLLWSALGLIISTWRITNCPQYTFEELSELAESAIPCERKRADGGVGSSDWVNEYCSNLKNKRGVGIVEVSSDSRRIEISFGNHFGYARVEVDMDAYRMHKYESGEVKSSDYIKVHKE